MFSNNSVTLASNMEAILYIGITQSMFAGLILMTQKHKKFADKVLSVWLFFIALSMAITLGGMFFPDIPLSRARGLIIPLTFGPFLYLYVSALIGEKQQFKKTDLLHFLPFVVFSIGTLLFVRRPAFDLTLFFENDDMLIIRLTYGAAFVASIFSYSVVVFTMLDRHRNNIKHYFSYSSEKITLTWLLVVSITFFVGFMLTILIGVYFASTGSFIFNPIIFANTGLTLIAFAFSFFGFRQPEIFKTSHPAERYIHPAEEHDKEEPVKYEKSNLKVADALKYLKQIQHYMDTQKPYLNGDLTLQDISEKLNIPKHYITQIINERLNKNFYNFVNQYRVEEAKRRIADPQNKNLTFIAIGYDSGFNSKSSFFTSFKRFTGKTPAQYRHEIYK